MTRYHSKQDLLDAITTEHRRLDACLTQLTREEMLLPGVVSTWCAKDLLAHLTAWEQLFMHWYEAGQCGVTPDPNPTGMSRIRIDALNSRIYLRNVERPLELVLAEYRETYYRVLVVVRGLSDSELFSPGVYAWTGRLRLVDYAAANTCQHYYWAKTMLRRLLAVRVNNSY
jgi:hypothetical protein